MRASLQFLVVFSVLFLASGCGRYLNNQSDTNEEYYRKLYEEEYKARKKAVKDHADSKNSNFSFHVLIY